MLLKLLEKSVHKGTDVVSFKFSRSYEQGYLNYKAGQFAIVDLGTKEDPEGSSRCFTIASSPTEKESILITTRIRDTPFKKKLADLKVGELVNIEAPLGRFVLHQDYSRPAIMLSGGIGVTPFRSMIKFATDEKLPIKIILFDANRNEDNIIYKNEFDEWVKFNKNLKIVYTIGQDTNNWKGETGHINKPMISKYLNEITNSLFYICGPAGLLNAMQKLLKDEMQIPENRIMVEEFTGY